MESEILSSSVIELFLLAAPNLIPSARISSSSLFAVNPDTKKSAFLCLFLQFISYIFLTKNIKILCIKSVEKVFNL